MKISFKIFKKWWFWLVTVLIILLIAFYAFLKLRLNDATFAWLIDDNGYELEATHYKIGKQNMRYVAIGGENRPLILLIHGAPSSSGGWENMFNDSLLVNSVKLIAVDRPGYGYSDFGKVELSLRKQAASIVPILEKYRKKHQTILVIGSSYGGPVAARMAMDYPSLIDGLCLISASVAPGEEKTYSASYPFTNPWLKWVVPPALNNAIVEKLNHRESLFRMSPDWQEIEVPTTIIHGKADELIYAANADFAVKKLINSVFVKKIMLPNMKHGLPFTHPNLIRKLMLEAVEQTQKYQ
jgi:pimeloyl-ACP methyl ester carboxylesterase